MLSVKADFCELEWRVEEARNGKVQGPSGKWFNIPPPAARKVQEASGRRFNIPPPAACKRAMEPVDTRAAFKKKKWLKN